MCKLSPFLPPVLLCCTIRWKLNCAFCSKRKKISDFGQVPLQSVIFEIKEVYYFKGGDIPESKTFRANCLGMNGMMTLPSSASTGSGSRGNSSTVPNLGTRTGDTKRNYLGLTE